MQKRRGGLWTESGILKGGNNISAIWPWCWPLAYRNYRTAQEKSVGSAKPRKQTSSGLTGDSFPCLHAASHSFTSTGLFADDIVSPRLINESGMTLLLEYSNMNCDFSNLPLSCAFALGNMYTLSKAVNEIKLSQKLVCSSLWINLSELLCRCSKQQVQGPRTLHQKHYESVCFPWEAEEYDSLKTPLYSLLEKKTNPAVLTTTGR